MNEDCAFNEDHSKVSSSVHPLKDSSNVSETSQQNLEKLFVKCLQASGPYSQNVAQLARLLLNNFHSGVYCVFCKSQTPLIPPGFDSFHRKTCDSATKVEDVQPEVKNLLKDLSMQEKENKRLFQEIQNALAVINELKAKNEELITENIKFQSITKQQKLFNRERCVPTSNNNDSMQQSNASTPSTVPIEEIYPQKKTYSEILKRCGNYSTGTSTATSTTYPTNNEKTQSYSSSPICSNSDGMIKSSESVRYHQIKKNFPANLQYASGNPYGTGTTNRRLLDSAPQIHYLVSPNNNDLFVPFDVNCDHRTIRKFFVDFEESYFSSHGGASQGFQ